MGREKSLGGLSHEDAEKKCPDCGSTDLDYKDGEQFCRKCGLIIE